MPHQLNLQVLSKSQTETLLGARDAYLSAFNVKNCLAVAGLESVEAVQEYLAATAEDFSQKHLRQLNQVFAPLAKSWEQYELPNLNLSFGASNGRDAWGMPYTRAQTIILPSTMARKGQLESHLSWVSPGLLQHEAFHVLSRAYPAIKTPVYALFGFRPLGFKVDLPEDAVVNPDAPTIEHAVEVETPTGRQLVVPYLQFREHGFNWSALWSLDKQAYLSAYETNYHEVIGGRIYSIHPEEIAAECFYHVLSKVRFPHVGSTNLIATILENSK